MKKKYIIKKFKGIDEISFGIERNNLRKRLEGKYREIKRNEYAENTSDYYEELGFFVEYSKDDICDAIEFTNEISLFFESKDLFSLKFSSLKSIYNKLSSNLEEEEGISVTYYDLGFGANCMNNDEVESIIIFSSNYWQ